MNEKDAIDKVHVTYSFKEEVFTVLNMESSLPVQEKREQLLIHR